MAAAGSAGRDCIFERLRIEHGYAGGYTVGKDYVRTARARSREVFVPLVHPPGHAQVDFGECVAVIGGVRMKLHVFCFDLSQSDACFSGLCHFLRGAGGG